MCQSPSKDRDTASGRQCDDASLYAARLNTICKVLERTRDSNGGGSPRLHTPARMPRKASITFWTTFRLPPSLPQLVR